MAPARPDSPVRLLAALALALGLLAVPTLAPPAGTAPARAASSDGGGGEEEPEDREEAAKPVAGGGGPVVVKVTPILGAIMVEAAACPPAAPAAADWHGDCRDPAAGARFALARWDGARFVPAGAGATDAAGRLRFDGLEPGTYRLRGEGAAWCHAEPDGVGAAGDVGVRAGQETRVRVFHCAAAATPGTETGSLAAAGAAGVVAERREVRGVAEVALEGVGTLVVARGGAEALTVEAEARVLPRIATEVRDGRLTIRPLGAISTGEPIVYRLTVKDLAAVEVSGAGRVEGSALAADRLRLAVGGSGGVALDGLVAGALSVSVSGSGEVALSGEVGHQEVELSGSGAYRAPDLASRTAAVAVTGSGGATVRVGEALEARVGGSGSITYFGDPRVSQEVSGSGAVAKAG